MTYIRDRYALIDRKYDRESLVDCLGLEEVTRLEQLQQDRIAAERKMKLYRGCELEKARVDDAADDQGLYSYTALQAGVQWPAGIDPTKREQYLRDEEFLTVFGMAKDSFNKFDRFKRIQLKKDKNLF